MQKLMDWSSMRELGHRVVSRAVTFPVQIGRRVEAATRHSRVHLVCNGLFAVCLLLILPPFLSI